MFSRADHIEPKAIEGGVIVPPGLQVGQMTLREHNDYLVWLKLQRPLTREEAIAAGHREAEVLAVYDPEPREPDEAPAAPGGPAPAPTPAPAPPPAAIGPPSQEGALTGVVARMRGYTGECCSNCHGFNVVNNGTCKLCTDCGTTTGCS